MSIKDIIPTASEATDMAFTTQLYHTVEENHKTTKAGKVEATETKVEGTIHPPGVLS
jgi:hypothetical protein